MHGNQEQQLSADKFGTAMHMQNKKISKLLFTNHLQSKAVNSFKTSVSILEMVKSEPSSHPQIFM